MEADKNTSCQNWTKRDWRNNQQEQEQQEEREQKAMYKTAAQLAVKTLSKVGYFSKITEIVSTAQRCVLEVSFPMDLLLWQ